MANKKQKLDLKNILLGNMVLDGVFLILGIIIYMNPSILMATVGILMGVSFILFGAYDMYLYKVKPTKLFRYRFIVGILAILLGLFMIINPFKIIKILTFTFGIYLIISSIKSASNSVIHK